MREADRWGALQVQQLRALVAVVAEGSFAAAGASLGYTESGISQQILALERTVGERVLVRHPGGRRPPELTAAGRVVAGHARAMLGQVTAMGAGLTAVATGAVATDMVERVAVITIASLGARMLPQILTRVRRVHPDLQVTITEALRFSVVLEALQRGSVDVALAARPPDEEAYEICTLASDPYVLVTRADRGERGLDDLDGVRVLTICGTAHDELLEQQLSARRVVPAAVERFNDNTLLAALVAAGEGVAVVPRLTIDLEATGLLATPLPELPPRELAAFTRRGRRRPRAVEAFLGAAAAVCEQSPAQV